MTRPSDLALAALPTVACLLLAIPSHARAPATIAADQLLPHAVGDRWLFGGREQQPTSSLLVSEPREGGFVLEDGDGNLRVLRIDPQAGLVLIASEGLEEGEQTFDPPLSLLPPRVVAGATHTAESAIVEWRGGEEHRRGVRRVEATIAAPSHLGTPAGEWEAWPVSTVITTTWEGEETPIVTRDETWYAPGVGPVRRRIVIDGAPFAEALIEAKVGGRLLPP